MKNWFGFLILALPACATTPDSDPRTSEVFDIKCNYVRDGQGVVETQWQESVIPIIGQENRYHTAYTRNDKPIDNIVYADKDVEVRATTPATKMHDDDVKLNARYKLNGKEAMAVSGLNHLSVQRSRETGPKENSVKIIVDVYCKKTKR